LATPNGIPMIVRHWAVLATTCARASHQAGDDHPENVCEAGGNVGVRSADDGAAELPQRKRGESLYRQSWSAVNRCEVRFDVSVLLQGRCDR
jgi:hypothetical protein